jgi:hypothetical protein
LTKAAQCRLFCYFFEFLPTSLHAFVTLRKIPRLSVIHHFYAPERNNYSGFGTFHNRKPMEKKLGLSALTALVLSSMLGAGVFSLPQNMAAVASPPRYSLAGALPASGYCCWRSPCCCSPAFARIWTAVFSPMRVKDSAS